MTKPAGKLGAFGGVFTPNVLTILGVIIFLRAGWVAGNAGLKDALLILFIATGIALLTALSLSAIAINTRAEGGGAYFLIARSLGLEIGGSIGLPLYLGQAVAVGFYIVGFVESLRFIWPNLPVTAVGFGGLGFVFVVAWLGAEWATKAQYFIIGALGLALLSFFAGWSPVAEWGANWEPQYQPGHSFWTVFAIYFPPLTGIMAGVSMSGDLKDPARAIPRGTLWSVAVTFAIYGAQLVWLTFNADRSELVANTMVMERIARVPALIYVGIWAATLSSAIAVLVAAPRTLQALGRDGVMPRWLGRGQGPTNEPRVALILTTLIAGAAVWVGEINVIAPLISMFFLTTYTSVNLVAGLERLIQNPSYRPTFRVNWLPSLACAAGCGIIMFLLNPLAALVAGGLMAGAYSVLRRRRYRTAWGDMRSGVWFSATRFALLRLAESRQHVRNWRPIFLVLVGSPTTRQRLVDFANWLEAGRGLLFLAQIQTGPWQQLLPRRATAQQAMETFIRRHRLSAVAESVLAEDFEHGVITLLQTAGLGPLRPNTVMVGWSQDEVKQPVFSRTIRRILELQQNLHVHSPARQPDDQLTPFIDVWWRAKDNGSMMLTLAHLLRGNGRWRRHTIRVHRILPQQAGRPETEAKMRELLKNARIEADVLIHVTPRPPTEVIGEVSTTSAVGFFGLSLPGNPDHQVLTSYAPLVAQLNGDVLLAKNWHDLEL